MTFAPHFWTSHLGSVPYTGVDGLAERLADPIVTQLAMNARWQVR